MNGPPRTVSEIKSIACPECGWLTETYVPIAMSLSIPTRLGKARFQFDCSNPECKFVYEWPDEILLAGIERDAEQQRRDWIERIEKETK